MTLYPALPMRCPKCLNTFLYTGKSNYSVNCPKCTYKCSPHSHVLKEITMTKSETESVLAAHALFDVTKVPRPSIQIHTANEIVSYVALAFKESQESAREVTASQFVSRSDVDRIMFWYEGIIYEYEKSLQYLKSKGEHK